MILVGVYYGVCTKAYVFCRDLGQLMALGLENLEE